MKSVGRFSRETYPAKRGGDSITSFFMPLVPKAFIVFKNRHLSEKNVNFAIKIRKTMLYPDNFEYKLRFDVVRQQLTDACLCTLGTERVTQMEFCSNHERLTSMLRQTTEFVTILQEDEFPDQHFFDVRPSLKRIRVAHTFLDERELFDLQRSLSTICDIVAFLKKGHELDNGNMVFTYPTLHTLSQDVRTFPQVVKRIGQILDKFGNIKDNASPTLAQIRHDITATTNSISRSLQSILKSAKSDGLVDKDIAPTMRDGRLVIPVAPALKRKIKGIVHDESDTGKTVYIEPAEVVEANNRIRELESDERREIMRILLEMADTLRPEAQDIIYSYEFLADIDFIRAKARFAIANNCYEPKIENRPAIDWGYATHPLLEQALRKHDKKVVPLDIELTPSQRLLVISGPNAGGKSVCLKTVGLLQYMMQCGMLVPMSETSRMGVFKSIFIDIGDDQSIEDDLSTYSSHLLHMKNIMRHADGTSLVLIDEFGGGTEPQIGGAMAEAVLKRINAKKAFGVITTHYQNLKLLAKDTEGLVNGAMLYDRNEMQPLFQLRIGNPGSSFAVEIARKIGIPADVIKDASEIVGQDYINADKYLQDIVRDKRYWENKRDAIHQHEKQLQQTIDRYEKEIEALKEEKREIIAKAKAQALEIITQSNSRIELTIKEIKEAEAEKERTRQARQELNDFKQELREIDPGLFEGRIKRQMEKVKARQERKKKKNDEKAAKAQTTAGSENKKPVNAPLVEGDFVVIKGQSAVGQINKINGKQAQVTFGSMVTNIALDRLLPSSPPKKEERADTFLTRQTQDDIRDRKLEFRQDIDVRGMRGDEAVQAITYSIDDALVAGVSRVRILHGTGSGILRSLIRQYLSNIEGVADFHDEDIRLGGAGITVVDLI